LINKNNIFKPFGVETLGSWDLKARSLFKGIAKRLVEVSRDQKAVFFAQRISIAIQRGNVSSFLGTLPAMAIGGEEFHDT
jgi:hypothetical protein